MMKFCAAHIKAFCPLLLLVYGLSGYAQPNAHSLSFNLQNTLSVFTANQNPLQGNAYGGQLAFHYNTEHNNRQWASDIGIKSVNAIFDYKRMHEVTLKSAPRNGDLGDSYAVFAGVSLPVFSINKVQLVFAPAFGVVYAEESWFSNGNPIVGSRLNFGMLAALQLSVPISDKFELGTNVNVLHYSNGGTRVPNNGMNVVNLGLSLKHYFNTSITKGHQKAKVVEMPKHSYDLAIGVGRRGAYQSKKGLFRTALYGGYNYRLKSYLALGVGVDAVYYHTVYDPNRNLETYQSKASSFKRWRVGTAIGPDLCLGKLAIMLKYGYYIYYDSFKPVSTYWTAGAKYKITNSLALQSKIYIHNTEADFIGFGVMFTK